MQIPDFPMLWGAAFFASCACLCFRRQQVHLAQKHARFRAG